MQPSSSSSSSAVAIECAEVRFHIDAHDEPQPIDALAAVQWTDAAKLPEQLHAASITVSPVTHSSDAASAVLALSPPASYSSAPTALPSALCVSPHAPACWRSTPGPVLRLIAAHLDERGLACMAGVDLVASKVCNDANLWHAVLQFEFRRSCEEQNPPALVVPVQEARKELAARRVRMGGARARAELRRRLLHSEVEAHGRSYVAHMCCEVMELPILTTLFGLLLLLVPLELARNGGYVTMWSIWPLVAFISLLTLTTLFQCAQHARVAVFERLLKRPVPEVYTLRAQFDELAGPVCLPRSYASVASLSVGSMLSAVDSDVRRQIHLNYDRQGDPQRVTFGWVLFRVMLLALSAWLLFVAVKVSGHTDASWWSVMSPVYLASTCSLAGGCYWLPSKPGVVWLCLIWPFTIGPTFVFTLLLPLHLEQGTLTLLECLSPLWYYDAVLLASFVYATYLSIDAHYDPDEDKMSADFCCIITPVYMCVLAPFTVFKLLLVLYFSSESSLHGSLSYVHLFIPLFIVACIFTLFGLASMVWNLADGRFRQATPWMMGQTSGETVDEWAMNERAVQQI